MKKETNKQYVPFAKLSKKEKKALNAEKRTVWNVCPVTRRPEVGYDRNKAKASARKECAVW